MGEDVTDNRQHATADDIAALAVAPGATVREAVTRLDRAGRAIALVLDARGALVRTITDGDVRRALLAGVTLDEPIEQLARGGPTSPSRTITAPVGTDAARLLAMMRRHGVRHVPLLDDAGRVAALADMRDLVAADDGLKLTAVVMAGGKGLRLRPLTADTPKPMLPVAGRPLLERIVGQLRGAGIREISISTNYLADRIRAHFGDGAAHGVSIRYLAEDKPLGTAGALSMLDAPDDEAPSVVINGDILTTADLSAMLTYHREHAAALTVAVREHAVTIPYGVVDVENGLIAGLREKPTSRVFVNAGIYLVEPALRRRVPAGQRFDMTDLIELARGEGLPVAAFPLREDWLDIGRPEDYERAQAVAGALAAPAPLEGAA